MGGLQLIQIFFGELINHYISRLALQNGTYTFER